MLDDGATERAPVFGVLAGLRAAKHDTCLVLPVDTPLVTPALLRELLAAGAVPQTGPLPGVYTKSMLPELEQRVAAGELSLRGVNPKVLDVNEAQLLNVNTPTDLIVAAAEALDTFSQGRPVALPDEAAMLDLSSDFWSTALWAARKLRRGEVFAAVDGVNGAMKRSLVTLLSWHARAVDADADVWDAGRFLERWADPGALAALERAYAHYDLRDVSASPMGDDRPLPGARGGDGATARAPDRARPRGSEAARGRDRPRSEARGVPSRREAAPCCSCVRPRFSSAAAETTSRAPATTTVTPTAISVYFLLDGKVWPVRRELRGTNSETATALSTLAAGPTEDEIEALGLSSEVPEELEEATILLRSDAPRGS